MDTILLLSVYKGGYVMSMNEKNEVREFEVGDRVKYAWTEDEGEVIRRFYDIATKDTLYRVKWDDGTTSCYHHNCLNLIESTTYDVKVAHQSKEHSYSYLVEFIDSFENFIEELENCRSSDSYIRVMDYYGFDTNNGVQDKIDSFRNKLYNLISDNDLHQKNQKQEENSKNDIAFQKIRDTLLKLDSCDSRGDIYYTLSKDGFAGFEGMANQIS